MTRDEDPVLFKYIADSQRFKLMIWRLLVGMNPKKYRIVSDRNYKPSAARFLLQERKTEWCLWLPTFYWKTVDRFGNYWTGDGYNKAV